MSALSSGLADGIGLGVNFVAMLHIPASLGKVLGQFYCNAA
ncbi:hypothetical protein [Labrys sp. ZIDIC5]|nr:hypothetical protein [Labrys sp. ZIDIC5]MDZ5452425.1 hypothetical protein [Labrys sp. ZIDIC5]